MAGNIQLGLRQNWQQFVLLIIVNGFVGGMIGMERTVLPQLGETYFALQERTIIFSFIVVFGIAKAITNYFAGTLSNRFGRKRLLLAGLLFGLPVPFMLMYAGTWNWIVAANVLLGVNQGLAWSSTVIMKIDLVGEKNRGFAMGLNEFAGYVSVAITAFATGAIASTWGLRPYPFYIGVAMAIAAIVITLFFVKDTQLHVRLEGNSSSMPKLKNVFWHTTWLHPNLGSVTQAGLVNNLNDGMAWGLLPMLLASKGFDLHRIGIIVAIYPAVWGIGQIFAGKLADQYCKKTLLFHGMLLQGVVLLAITFASSFMAYIILSGLLGIGTALVYPTFLAAVSDYTHPHQRAESLGIFRLWRDLGYAIGGLLTGIIADRYGLAGPVVAIGILTIASSVVVKWRMKCEKRNKPALELKYY